VVLLLWRRPPWRTWAPAERWAVVAFGAALALMNLAFYLAIDRLPLGNAVAIEFLGPIAVAVVGARTRRNVAALAVAIAGVGLLADVELAGNPLGVTFALAAAICWAGYIVFGQRVATLGLGVDGLAAAGAVGVLAIAPLGAPAAADAAAEPWVLFLALGVGVLSSVIPYGLDQVVLARIDRHQFALLLALLPATATVVGAIVLQQVPSAIEVVAIGLVVAGVLIRER
jgi:inner membrane transporter RhtA